MLGSKRCRRHTKLLFETLCEIRVVVEAYFIAYPRDRVTLLLQQLRCPFESKSADKFGGGLACDALQFTVQLGPAHS